MNVTCLESLEALESIADDWDRWTEGMPLRRRAWLLSWWNHFGRREPNRRLFVAVVRDEQDHPIGIAPWLREHSWVWGYVLRPLGSGSVCTDYQTILAEPGRENDAARALAAWLSGRDRLSPARPPAWDLIHLTGLSLDDRTMSTWARAMQSHGSAVDCRLEEQCWRIALPEGWDAYEGQLSKSHRKQIRRLDRRVLQTDRARLRRVTDPAELPEAMAVLIDLHQRRRRNLGEPGCFADPRFGAFLMEAAVRLLAERALNWYCLEVDGRPIAAEFHLYGNGATYAYQAGIDPDRLDEEPGRLMTLATIREAVERGDRAFDFLRGNEPYKAHFRAEPQPMYALLAAPAKPGARLRRRVWRLGSGMKHWLRRGRESEKIWTPQSAFGNVSS